MANVLTSLQQEILMYLHSNSNAAETVEGVNRMWLKRPAAGASIAECEQALEGLVQRALLEKHRLPGNSVIYRLRRNHDAG